MAAVPTIRIIANTAVDRATRCKTVNVSTVPHFANHWKQYTQASGKAPAHEFPEVIAGATGAGPFKNGFPTIYVPGFTPRS